MLTKFHHLSWSLLLLLTGYMLGIFVLKIEAAHSPAPIQVLESDVNEPVPVVRLNEINNGAMVGSIDAGARLVIADQIVTPNDEGRFRIPAGSFLVNVINVQVPERTKFVASKRGKKYYAIEDNGWRKLKSELVFFQSREEAINAGYTQ